MALRALDERYRLEEVARAFGVSVPTVRLWRDRYRELGRSGMSDPFACTAYLTAAHRSRGRGSDHRRSAEAQVGVEEDPSAPPGRSSGTRPAGSLNRGRHPCPARLGESSKTAEVQNTLALHSPVRSDIARRSDDSGRQG